MVANGHSWSSIKQYTLSEIGIFFKTIVLKEREIKAERITDNWISNNYQYEDLQKMISQLVKVEHTKKEKKEDTEAIKKDWSRLAQFMSGRK